MEGGTSADVLINTIPLLEARASSEIENIVTTTDRLFRYAQPDREAPADPATKEALRYRTALRRGVDLLKKPPLATATAVEVCRTLLGQDLDVRRVPGTALVNEGTGEVVYTPPEGEAGCSSPSRQARRGRSGSFSSSPTTGSRTSSKPGLRSGRRRPCTSSNWPAPARTRKTQGAAR